MCRKGWILALVTVVLLAPVAVLATETQHLELVVKVEKEVLTTDEDGNARVALVEPELVLPSEEVLYTIRYRNTSDEQTDNVVITNPIPEHMVYTTESAAGDGTRVLFSADGNEFASPRQLIVRLPDGGQRPARASDYTHIRWVLQTPLDPGDAGEVSYRARLE